MQKMEKPEPMAMEGAAKLPNIEQHQNSIVLGENTKPDSPVIIPKLEIGFAVIRFGQCSPENALNDILKT